MNCPESYNIDDILNEFHSDDIYGSIQAENEEVSARPEKSESAPVAAPKSESEVQPVALKKVAGSEESGGKAPQSRFLQVVLSGVLFIVAALLTVLVSKWTIANVHPDVTKKTINTAKNEINLVSRFQLRLNNLESDALSDVAYIRKRYSIPEDAAVAPVPNAANFGETTDPALITALIEKSSELLEGQEMIWNPDIEIIEGSTIKYYCDETILAIVWKERVGRTACTFSEIRIADASQFRRHLAGDEYASSIQLKASDMAKTVNAVVAMNGDFYAFRQTGVIVYDRKLYRFDPTRLDTCFWTSSGNMIFSHIGELTTREETEQFIADNDILFSTSFGPILVENGELYYTATYAAGEVNDIYARAAIGMTDDLHYLLMVTSTDGGSYVNGMTVMDSARLMLEKGCYQAYELDGGQTATIVYNGEPANGIVYGYERTMSDIIYFATAIPSEENS